MVNVLYVDWENHFPGPYAAAYTMGVFYKQEKPNEPSMPLRVNSAGLMDRLSGQITLPANGIRIETGIAVMLCEYERKSLDRSLVEQADIIVPFDFGQAKIVVSRFPEAAHKTTLLSQMAFPNDTPRAICLTGRVGTEVTSQVNRMKWYVDRSVRRLKKDFE